MRAYSMQGTPTLILIDREGRLRQQIFGGSDMTVAAAIAALVAESFPAIESDSPQGAV